MIKKVLTVGSLFSGIGGMELGLESTGEFETIWFCENDKYASAVLRKHWTEVKNYGDIKKVKWEEVEKPEVLTEGFPCQDISVAGKGKGIKKETRSGLWFEFAKAIRILRPRFVIVENVPMLANRGLTTVLGNLAEMGYDAEWGIVSAREVGAPHKRERLFIIAHPTGKRCSTGGGYREGGQVLSASEREVEEDKQAGDKRLSGPSEGVDAPDLRSQRIQRKRKGQIQELPGFSWCEGIGRVEDLFNRPDIPEPLVRGGNDGVPNRMDRTKCLGNAIVPQVAREVGLRLLDLQGAKEAKKDGKGIQN